MFIYWIYLNSIKSKNFLRKWGLKLNKIIAYSLDFTSFLLENIESEGIKNIILFGSVTRNEETKDSDVDIFIDVIDEKKYKNIPKLTDKFFNSSKFLNYWKLKGIKNEFNVIVGRLDNWKELKNSIISNGIMLYSKFKEIPENQEYKTLFSFERIKPESKRIMLFKNLYGYKKNNRFYAGLLQKYNGLKLSSGTIIVPLEHYKIFYALFKKYSINVKILKIIEYK